MSALAGIFRVDGRPVEHCELERMIESMAHRGPDGAHVWADGPVGLGHRMLYTTPESLHEELPWTDPASGLTITADARIDNRDELIGKLGLGAEARSLPDSALILRAYAKWGRDCVDHLIGDFAFAIWDPHAQRLFCARDHFGGRPLYYHWKPGHFLAFASELKAILALPGLPKKLNEVSLADNLVILREDDTSTIYEGLVHLPRAHTLTLEESGLRLERYYTLAPAEGVEGWSDEAYIEGFRERFEEAVRCRVRSAFPVGAQLSGGLDSSAVTCVARDALTERGDRLHTFTLVFKEVPRSDESKYAKEVIAQGGLEPHYVPGDAQGPLSNLEELYSLLDDRSVGGGQHNVWALLKAAQGAGVRIVLDGIDGDNTVGHGLRYLGELAADGAWEQFAQEVRLLVERNREADHRHPFEIAASSTSSLVTQHALPALQRMAEAKRWRELGRATSALHKEFGVRRRQLLGRVWKVALVPRWILERRRATKRFPINEQALALLDRDFADRMRMRERMESAGATSYAAGRDLSEREFQRRVLDSPMMQLALTTTNHVGSQFGLEVRHPFMDKRLIEYCLALPPSLSLRNGWTRYVLRKGLENVLPEAVTRRVGKTDMTAAFAYGLARYDGDRLRDLIETPGVLADYLDVQVLHQLHAQALAADPLETSMERTLLAGTVAISTWVNRWFGAGGEEECRAATLSQSEETPEIACA